MALLNLPHRSIFDTARWNALIAGINERGGVLDPIPAHGIATAAKIQAIRAEVDALTSIFIDEDSF